MCNFASWPDVALAVCRHQAEVLSGHASSRGRLEGQVVQTGSGTGVRINRVQWLSSWATEDLENLLWDVLWWLEVACIHWVEVNLDQETSLVAT